jgi:hypothetical protein
VKRRKKLRRKMWKRRRKLRSKLLRRRLRRRRKMMRRTEKRKEIELKGGKHNRTALYGVFYHFLTKNHLGIFVSLPPNHHGKFNPNFIKWDPKQFKKSNSKKKIV